MALKMMKVSRRQLCLVIAVIEERNVGRIVDAQNPVSCGFHFAHFHLKHEVVVLKKIII